MKISDRLYILKVQDGREPIYPALIRTHEGLMLVDACYPGQMEALASAMKEHGFTPAQITHICFTHQDIDHIGVAREIIAAADGVITLAHEEERPYIDGEKVPIKLAARLAAAQDDEATIMLKKGFEARRIPITRTLKHGELAFPGVRVVYVPGHTPGHICLYCEQEKLLIAGDALITVDGALQGPNPVYTYDMQLATRSLEQLLDYDIEHVLCYHGGPVQGDASAALAGLIRGDNA